jgi:hypothetical protein
MSARPNPLLDTSSAADSVSDVVRTEPRTAVARLAILHAEAAETARLANLLGRSFYAAIALPIAAGVTIAFSTNAGAPRCVAWAVLVIAASLAIARAYAVTIGQPFERAVLNAFSQDLSAVLLYAGLAWGAGAFLVLSNGAHIGSAVLFASAPALALAVLLRERNEVLLFLAPVVTLTSFACVLRPLAGGALEAALVLISCAIVAGAIFVADRRRSQISANALPLVEIM